MENSKSGRSANSPLKILIAADHSEASLCAVRFACELAPPDSVIRIVSVVPLTQSIAPSGHASTTNEDSTRSAAQALSSANALFIRAGFEPETATIALSVKRRDVVHAIVDAAASWNADIVVVGAHQRHSLLRYLKRNVSEPLVKLCALPILIVPQRSADMAHGPYRILFAVGSVADTQRCVRLGVRFATAASRFRAVYVIGRSVWWPGERRDGQQDEGAMALEAARELLGAGTCTTTSTIGPSETAADIADALVCEAVKWDADLLVMGTHTRHGLKRFAFGSVAHRVLLTTRTPILLVNREGS
ncbi:universal stress protein [Paraburkholderia sp. J94]|uniref:universal stress protein n=1 Tax=Paraburkholderia sp. J94 TaxID=2805441 RepID=UPI002AB2F34D|nr:universal stress protein [Paraburkholderia sp. J94]